MPLPDEQGQTAGSFPIVTPMTLSTTSVFFILLGFVVAFTLGRVLRHHFKKRQRLKDEQTAARNESRQVRRARARSRSGR